MSNDMMPQSLLNAKAELEPEGFLRIEVCAKTEIASLARVVDVWESIAGNHAALRTILPKAGSTHEELLQSAKVRDCIVPVTLGHTCRWESPDHHPPAGLVVDLNSTTFDASIRIHPALIDVTSAALVRQNFADLADSQARPRQTSFDKVTPNLSPEDEIEAKTFWHDNLTGLSTSPFHCFGIKQPESFAKIRHGLPRDLLSAVLNATEKYGLSLRTMLQGAWAIVVAVHSQASNGKVAFSTIGRRPKFSTAIGPFDRQYVLAVPINGNRPMKEWLKDIEDVNHACAEHSLIGYETILDEAVGFVPASHLHVRTAGVQELAGDRSRLPSLQLDAEISSDSSAVAFTLHYDAQIAKDEARVLLDHLTTALERICSADTVADCSVLSLSESTRLLDLAKPATNPVEGLVHHLFERQVVLTPSATALQFEASETRTYSELNRLANGVARQLDCKRGALIPVSVPRSINLIVAILAIVKAGCAYVPLDPSVPNARNQFIYQDVDAPFALVSNETAGVFTQELVIEDLVNRAEQFGAEDLNIPQAPDELVYAVYTSGSTGRPKGVLLEHKAAYTGLVAFPRIDNLRQLLFHNPVFSAAQRSIWSTLKQGGCLCLASKDNLTSMISETINLMQVNVIDVTPSTASFITPGTVPSLRRMTVAGELINPALVPLWVNELEFLNAYGLSENTQFNWRRVIEPGQDPQNIGRPSDTTTAYVLVPGTTDLAPLLVPGELCLGGHQLAREYLNRPEKTSEVFIPNPFGEGRLYRTGDLVVTHADGSIEMIGRIDFSVKINDQRVDPGEPNSLIQMHEGVSDSAVVAANVSGSRALVAVVQTATSKDFAELKTALATHLAQHLPAYMIPAYWLVRSEELPLNINGKVDIPLLQRMCEELGWQGLCGRLSTSCDREWTTEEVLIRDIFAKATSVPAEDIGPADSFLDIGGNSLSALQVVGLANKRGLRIQMLDLLQGLSITELATKSSNVPVQLGSSDTAFSLAPDGFVVDSATMEDAFPATPLQEALLADSLLQKADYMIKKAYRTDGVSEPEVVAAVKAVISHSPLLRSTFVPHGASFLQVVKKELEPVWHHLDLELEAYADCRNKLLSDDRAGILEEPLLRIVMLKSCVVLEMHHALCDHWSAEFFIQDIRLVLNKEPLPERPPFRNFVRYIQGLDQKDALAYWQRRLSGLTATWLEQGLPVAFSKRIDLDFELEAAENSGTASSIVYLAWAIVLSKITGSKDVTFGVTASGRDAPVRDIANLEGPTVSVAPLRISVDAEQSIQSSLDDVKKAFWELSSNSHVGMHHILRQEGVPDRLFNTIVNVLVRPPGGPVDGVLEPMEDLLETELDMLHVDYFPQSRRLRIASASSFPDAERLSTHFVAVLRLIIENVKSPVGTALTMLNDAPPTPPSSVKTANDSDAEEDLPATLPSTPGLECRFTSTHELPRSDKTALTAQKQRVHSIDAEEITAEPTILQASQVHTTRVVTELSVPTSPAPDKRALWSATLAILLSRHTGTQSPLFGWLPQTSQQQVFPQLIHIDPAATVGELVDAVRQGTGTHASTDTILPWVGQQSSFEFQGASFDTILEIRHEKIFAASVQHEQWLADQNGVVLSVIETSAETLLQLSSHMDEIRATFVLESLALIAEAIVLRAHKLVCELDIVSAAERQHLKELASYSSPTPGLLHSSFEMQARINPNAVALQLENSVQVTYGELNSRANRLARYLLQAGVTQNQAVALYLRKSADMLVSIFAVLKAGAFYVPLSPDNSAERNAHIMDAVDASFLITSTAVSALPDRPGQEVIVVDEIDLTPFADTDIGIGHPDNLAYIIFTSGSTGAPKGVKISHRAISTAMSGIIDAEGTDSSWRFLFFFNYTFDASVHDIFPTLSSGGTLCVASEDRLLSDLAGVINDMGVEQLLLMPTVARLLRPEDVPSVKTLIVGGEALQPEIIQAWAQERVLIQMYGPTEASVIVTSKVMTLDSDPTNLGKPINTSSAMVLDFDSSRFTPFGSIGELCLAGDQLADGYWARDDLTAKAFIANPLSDDPSSRAYRTGDRVRWLSGGELEYHGREDHQVKLNGFRIELGEVEQTILQTGLVRNCAVTIMKQSGRPQLAAFCIVEPSDELAILDPSRFSDQLATLRNSMTSLAHYMIPKFIFPMGRFPMMPASTKTDRKALNSIAESLSNVELGQYVDNVCPEQASSKPVTSSVLTEEEIFLQQTWSELFNVPRDLIGLESSFFAIGGDSISAIIFVSMCRKAGYTLTVGDVAADKELGKIAAHLQRKAPTTNSPPCRTYTMPSELLTLTTRLGMTETDIDYVYPCPAGQTEWLSQGNLPTQNWCVTAARPFSPQHDVKSYIELVKEMTHQYDILRTTFTCLPNHGWVGVVLRASVVDFEIRACGKDGRQLAMDELARTRFQFGRPFIRYLLLRYPDGSRDLVIKASHGLWDGTSLRILDEAILASQQTGQVPPNTPWRDFALAEWNSDKKKSLSFWKKQVSIASPAWPPARKPITTRIYKHAVDLKAKIDDFAKACGVTPAIVFQAAFQVWQASMSGLNLAGFDYLLTGRNVDLPNPQSINGPCANFLPFKILMNRSERIQDFLQRTQSYFWEATEHSNVGLADIRKATGQEVRNTSLFLFQPFEKSSAPAPTQMRWLVLALSQAQMNQPYAFIQEISKPPGDTGYSFDMKFDEAVLSLEDVQSAIACQVELLGTWMSLGGGVALEQTVPQMVRRHAEE